MVASSRCLYAYLNGRKVGELVKRRDGALIFCYAEEWLASADARPLSLSLPLTGQPLSGPGVINYFDNLLPDNPQIRARIQARFQTETQRPFDLLAQIGGDCVGALQLSESEELLSVRDVTAKSASEQMIAESLRGYRIMPLGMSEESDFRISIAGAQEKSAFLWHEGEWKIPFGTTPTSHIFKLPIGNPVGRGVDLSDSCENEWLTMQIVKAFGLPAADVMLEQFEDQRVLIVERFDRRWSEDDSWLIRLPQEDMCQALGVAPARKYESDGGPGIAAIMDLLNYAYEPQQDRETFMKAQFVYWLLAAIDGHGKNFSLFMMPQGRYRMTPLYDVISAHPYVATGEIQKKSLKMAMALQGKNRHYHVDKILPRHWLSTAQRVGFSQQKMTQIMAACLDSVDEVIDEVEKQILEDFPEYVAVSVFSGMRALRDRALVSFER